MPYTLAYKDRFIRGFSPITRDVCEGIPFPFFPQNEPTQIRYNWTGGQISKLASVIKTGADLMFPNEANDILWDFLEGLSCLPELPEEGGCFAYLPSAPFISFFPDNPYIAGDTSSGWNKEAWYLWPQFDSFFPDWFDNWLNGLITELTQYQASDVLFNIESIPINPIDAWINGGGILPKIEIRFSGTGKLNLQLLSFPLGGKAIIELDSEPNALDILTGGILDPAAFMVELNRDVVNFPPDEYPLISIPIEVTEAGDHVLYVVFIPILNDELLPIGFGGGFRGIEFCDFTDGGTQSMIENLVWTGCELQAIIDGEPVTIVSAQDIVDCATIEHPEGGGGGGGGASQILIGKHQVAANLTTSSTSYVDLDATNIKQDVVLTQDSKVSAAFYIPETRKFTAGTGTFQLIANGTGGGQELVVTVKGANEGRGLWLLGTWDLAAGSYTIKPQFKSSNANNIAVEANNNVTWKVYVFEDLEADFVQDIRIESGQLQKQIGGVWYDVVDSFAAIIAGLQSQINSVQATANSALTAASAAQSTANGAVATNVTQSGQITAIQAVNTTQDTRITNLESLTTNHENRLDIAEADIIFIDGRVDVLDFGGAWAWEHDFASGGGGYSGLIGNWVNGQGWVSSGGLLEIQFGANLLENQISHVQVTVLSSYGGATTFLIKTNPSDNAGGFVHRGAGILSSGWFRPQNRNPANDFGLYMSIGAGEFTLKSARYLGRGGDVPFD